MVAAGLITAGSLRALTAGVFEKLGMVRADAELVADVLVWADLRGIGTHGLSRVPSYVERIETGEVDPAATPSVERRRAAVAVVDGNRCLGQLALAMAADEAIAMAIDAGAGWVSVGNASHAGAIGYFARRVADARMAAVVIGASKPLMLYHGSRSAGAGTNPLAIAVPGRDGHVLALDMAASTISRGRLAHHRRTGEPLDPGLAVDDAGRPTTDPHHASLPTPLGGPKGSGMATLFECISNVTAGMPLIEPTLSGRDRRHAQGGAVLALDIEAFRPFEEYVADVDALAAALRSLPPAAKRDVVLAPGDRGDQTFAERTQDGIPLPDKVRLPLIEIASRLGIEMPI